MSFPPGSPATPSNPDNGPLVQNKFIVVPVRGRKYMATDTWSSQRARPSLNSRAWNTTLTMGTVSAYRRTGPTSFGAPPPPPPSSFAWIFSPAQGGGGGLVHLSSNSRAWTTHYLDHGQGQSIGIWDQLCLGGGGGSCTLFWPCAKKFLYDHISTT